MAQYYVQLGLGSLNIMNSARRFQKRKKTYGSEPRRIDKWKNVKSERYLVFDLGRNPKQRHHFRSVNSRFCEKETDITRYF